MGLILSVFGLIIAFAAWYWPDYWKHPSGEKGATTKQLLPAGSEWRKNKPHDSFAFTRMDFPDAQSTFPTSINDEGDIAGIYQFSGGQRSFIRYRQGSITSFEYPNTAETTNATGINGNGEVVGFYYDNTKGGNGSPAHGFLRNKDGTFNSFSYPDAIHTFAHGINDKREIVGAYEDCDGLVRGFLFHSVGSFSSLDFPGAASTVPTGINNEGDIIGYWRDPQFGDRGFLRHADGTFVPIMPDPTTYTHPKGINNSGDLVGQTGLGTFIRRKDGTLSLFDHPACLGSSCTSPTGVNSQLEVVGHYQISSGVHGFIAKVKPKEESSRQ